MISVSYTYTPNYNLAKPSPGTFYWDEEVNENFDTIDTTLNTISTALSQHVNRTDNPHSTVYYQVGAAPAVHTHPGSAITSAVAQAENATKIGGIRISVSSTAPSSPSQNDLWVDTST